MLDSALPFVMAKEHTEGCTSAYRDGVFEEGRAVRG